MQIKSPVGRKNKAFCSRVYRTRKSCKSDDFLQLRKPGPWALALTELWNLVAQPFPHWAGGLKPCPAHSTSQIKPSSVSSHVARLSLIPSHSPYLIKLPDGASAYPRICMRIIGEQKNPALRPRSRDSDSRRAPRHATALYIEISADVGCPAAFHFSPTHPCTTNG